VVKTLRY